MKDTLVFVMAGGRGERLMPLTKDRTKSAVPFGGIYRLIDFTLSNCVITANQAGRGGSGLDGADGKAGSRDGKNGKNGSNGRAMGRWWIEINAIGATIVEDGPGNSGHGG